ncbi:palmitoyl-protein thioesterase precursor [Cordyceps fumosorosea ARSEF 2679]|uniref:Palmitoyl-protein thioesterase 1 n=1 Tax=Cordyceps fumosorosea (strain ARSEF 2679) TaxID=1081104 RepID=A0A167RKD3_CORFA|nr:palmitoyl-protein thioesterase precursor [Cordyceps fumosorosea ARSEF 2679]OAA58681.1 palmitoyl-protein thioesterase precursor [Cordyceps fumosorosea ARSEF 2679]
MVRPLAAAVFAISGFAAASSHTTAASDDTPLPVVIWHGLGDTFSGEGIQAVAALADAIHPGTFVHAVSLAGDDASADRSATFFGNVSAQVDAVCEQLASHPILSTAPAVDALGFSQGGQFLRAYVERCNNPPVRSLVTFGSQHSGIAEFRECGTSDFLCKGAMALLRFNTWSSFVQGRLVPAQYFRDPADLDAYLEGSRFLADVNNERPRKNATYKERLAGLTKFVMFLFEDDTMVHPRESSWFGEVTPEGKSVPLRGRPIYKEDWLGLRELDEKGGLVFRSITADHMQIPEQVLNETFRDFFGPGKRAFPSHRHEQPKVYGDGPFNLEL